MFVNYGPESTYRLSVSSQPSGLPAGNARMLHASMYVLLMPWKKMKMGLLFAIPIFVFHANRVLQYVPSEQ
jgi:hypothetical protein